MKIGNHSIGGDHPVYIIAEAGVNHNGDLDLAKRLIDVATEAAVDAIKFQSFKTEHLIIPEVAKADYQKVTSGSNQTQFEMLKQLEMKLEAMMKIQDYCKQQEVTFLTTPFDEASLEELDHLNVDAYKVSSTDTTNLLFLEKVAQKNKPIILSSGMCYLHEVQKAVATIQRYNTELALLQCTSNYPVRAEEANLRIINLYKREFDCIIGFSDHTEGIGASPYAVAMGAKVIEKHFTLDKDMEGPDHRASLSPEELKAFVAEIRKVEKYLGTEEKVPTPGERNSRISLQKCFVAKATIKQGDRFSRENIIGKRTGGIGLSVLNPEDVLGKVAQKEFAPNEIIEL